MRVRDLMTQSPQCINPDATLQEAAELMKSLDVGALPVCDQDRLTGMVTDRDIAVRCVCDGFDPTASRVRDGMTTGIVYCFEDQSAEEAAKIMRQKQIRRLPVLDRDKRLIGIVSLGDLAVESGDEEMVGHALEGISEPSRG